MNRLSMNECAPVTKCKWAHCFFYD